MREQHYVIHTEAGGQFTIEPTDCGAADLSDLRQELDITKYYVDELRAKLRAAATKEASLRSQIDSIAIFDTNGLRQKIDRLEVELAKLRKENGLTVKLNRAQSDKLQSIVDAVATPIGAAGITALYTESTMDPETPHAQGPAKDCPRCQELAEQAAQRRASKGKTNG
jgi:hypothetical protein